MKTLLCEFIRFCGVGSINTVFSLALILLLSGPLGFDYRIANALGYAAGLGLGFILHKMLTFRDTLAFSLSGAQFGRFVAIFAFAYAAQFAVLVLAVDYAALPVFWSQIFACGVYTVINYLGNKVLTFGRDKGAQP